MAQVAPEDAAPHRARAAEARFHALAEHVPQLVWTARLDGSWEYVNGRWESLTGIPREAALGLGWRDSVHPDDLARWTARMSERGVVGGAVVLPARLRARGGGYRRVWVQLERVRVEGSELWIGTGTPLDEIGNASAGHPGQAGAAPGQAERRAPQAPPRAPGDRAPTGERKEATPRFTRRVLDSIFTFVALLELDGTIVDVNELPLAATKARREDVVGQRFWAAPWGYHSPESIARVQDAIRRAGDGEIVRFDDETLLLDGTIGMADLQFAPLRDDRGRVTHVVACAVNITERTRAEAALRESEERFRVATKSADLMAAQTDADLRYRWVYDPHPEFQRAPMLGKRDDEIEDSEGARRLVELKRRVLETGAGAREEVTLLRHGGPRIFEVALEPIRDVSGAVTGVTTAAFDVTEHRRAQEALSASEQRYRTLFESIDEGLAVVQVIFDARNEAVDCRFVETNAAFERHTGFAASPGKTIRELAPGIEVSPARVFGEVARTRQAVRFEAYEPTLQRWFDVYAGPTGDPALHQVVIAFTNVTERRRTEAALRESEERARRAAEDAQTERRLLDAVLEATPIGIVVADACGKVLRANPAHQRLWGRTEPSASVAPHAPWMGWWADGGFRDGLPLAPREWALARALRGELVSGDTVEIEPEDAPGERRTIIISGAPVRDASGRVVGGVVAEMDITARVAAEAAVRRSEERYRLVARATNDVIWDWDLESGRVEWSDNVLQHFGCTPEELGDRVEDFEARVHPDDRARAAERLRAAIESGAESGAEEYRFRRQDGSYAFVLDRGHIARDESGKPVRMIGSMLDVSEQRRIEAALRESEERFRALADNMSQLAWIGCARGKLLWSNKRWLEYTGMAPERARDRGWESALHPEHGERVVRELGEHLQRGEAWEDTFPMRRADGTYRWFLSRAIPLRDDAGEVVRCFVTHTDVTAQREAEQALRDADRRKDEFLAMLAHELRNPLAPVRNAVQLLRMAGPREPGLDRLRDVIDRQVTHMARLIDDLLDVSRIARGRIQLRKERQDLAQIVRQTAEDYRASLEAAGLTLTLDVQRPPIWVDGDRTRLAQIVGNLLHNAGKFTERGGRVAVRVGADDAARSAILTVEDTGVGIEPAMLPRLFDPFAQAAQGLDRSKGGLGLGLALAKALVELHGGTVIAASEGVGKGSAFTVRLPLAPAAPEARPVGRAQGTGEGLRVVVIEDNEDAAMTLEMLLTLAGHQVTVALDGCTGIAAVRRVHPEVVICDIGLPGAIDGYAVGRAVRGEPGLAPALMIALSGYSQDEDRRRSREAGFDVHLAKPADLDALQSLLAGVERHA